MDDIDKVRPGKFLVAGPVWFVARKGVLDDGPNDFEQILANMPAFRPPGGPCIAAFSDHDLVQRFIACNGQTELEAFRFDKAADFVRFVRVAKQLGIHSVVVDLHEGRGHYVTLEGMLDGIRKSIENGGPDLE